MYHDYRGKIEEMIDKKAPLEKVTDQINSFTGVTDEERDALHLWAWAWYQTKPRRKVKAILTGRF